MQIHINSLETKANLTIVGKLRGKQLVEEKGKEKEESLKDIRIEDMEKVMEILRNKLGKVELENKNSQIQVQEN